MRTIVSILGGDKLLGYRIKNELDFHILIRKGMPLRVVFRVKKILGLSDADISRILGISSKTLLRKLRNTKTSSPTTQGKTHLKTSEGEKDAKSLRLSLVQSDRLYRFARILARARGVFGDEVLAVEWLKSPQYDLGGSVPIDLLRTDAGVQEVEHLLGRIEHGVIS